MAISELIVLWVDCMKCVGRSGASDRPSSGRRNCSVFSMQPNPVPVMMASGTVTSARASACFETASARFISRDMRRASITGNIPV